MPHKVLGNPLSLAEHLAVTPFRWYLYLKCFNHALVALKDISSTVISGDCSLRKVLQEEIESTFPLTQMAESWDCSGES